MAGIQDARVRWGVIQARGRTRGIIALVIVVVLVLVIAVAAKSNAAVVLSAVIVCLAAVAAVGVMIGKRKTGLSMTPEWKPEVDRDDDYDDDEAESNSAVDAEAQAQSVGAIDTDDEAGSAGSEPVRRLDAQVLGADLSKLGQVVTPKLAKSYAVGTLVLEGSDIVWEPGTTSRAAGIENLVAEPNQVSVVETTPLWGSWALLRVATVSGDEWCLRVPGSVDLAPAFSELGLALQRLD